MADWLNEACMRAKRVVVQLGEPEKSTSSKVLFSMKCFFATVPVCVHLDHGTAINYVKRGIELSVTSVMYDGSEEPLEINHANTSIITSIDKKYDVSVEAEVGSMGSRENVKKVIKIFNRE